MKTKHLGKAESAAEIIQRYYGWGDYYAVPYSPRPRYYVVRAEKVLQKEMIDRLRRIPVVGLSLTEILSWPTK